jgi:hypothetical protein
MTLTTADSFNRYPSAELLGILRASVRADEGLTKVDRVGSLCEREVERAAVMGNIGLIGPEAQSLSSYYAVAPCAAARTRVQSLCSAMLSRYLEGTHPR